MARKKGYAAVIRQVLNRSDIGDDIRFPIEYRQTVYNLAKKYGIILKTKIVNEELQVNIFAYVPVVR